MVVINYIKNNYVNMIFYISLFFIFQIKLFFTTDKYKLEKKYEKHIEESQYVRDMINEFPEIFKNQSKFFNKYEESLKDNSNNKEAFFYALCKLRGKNSIQNIASDFNTWIEVAEKDKGHSIHKIIDPSIKKITDLFLKEADIFCDKLLEKHDARVDKILFGNNKNKMASDIFKEKGLDGLVDQLAEVIGKNLEKVLEDTIQRQSLKFFIGLSITAIISTFICSYIFFILKKNISVKKK
jgi:hypothetical protein